MVGIVGQHNRALLGQPVNQNLNILPRSPAPSRSLGDSLSPVGLEGFEQVAGARQQSREALNSGQGTGEAKDFSEEGWEWRLRVRDRTGQCAFHLMTIILS